MPQRQTKVQIKDKIVEATLCGEYGFDDLVNLSCILGSRWTPSSQVLVLDFSKAFQVDGDGARFFMNNLSINVQHGGTVYLVKAPMEIRRCLSRFGGTGNFRCVQTVRKNGGSPKRRKEGNEPKQEKVSRLKHPSAPHAGA